MIVSHWEVADGSIDGLAATSRCLRRARETRLSAVCRKVAYITEHLLLIDSFAPVKRILDLAGAVTLLVMTAPLLILRLVRSASRRAPLFERNERVGRHGARFFEYCFAGSGVTARAPALLNILRGEMSLIGPRPVSPGDPAVAFCAGVRNEVKPGLICSWWLRQRANIDFDEEAATDREYVQSATLRTDFGIAFRALPALFYGEKKTAFAPSVDILGLRIDNLSMTETLDWIAGRVKERGQARICMINAHCANVACTDRGYRDAVLSADLNLADGIGLKIAGKLKRSAIKQNVNGTDLFPRLCAALSETGKSIYLLGGGPGVPEAAAAWNRKNHPDTNIAGVRNGYFSQTQVSDVTAEIRRSGADILLVAMGVPLQDIWIQNHLAETGVRVAIGVGGLFDFYSGRIPRAPLWMREIGMEWAYRLYQEPGRMWKRYLVGNWAFLARLLLHELQVYHPHCN